MESDIDQKNVPKTENQEETDHEMTDRPHQSEEDVKPSTFGHTDSRFAPPIPNSANALLIEGIMETTEKPVPAPKKKGTAATVKKTPKRGKGGAKFGGKAVKKIKKPADTAPVDGEEDDDEGDGSTDEESDHGPYCICRGPDDHRWMISCDHCEDWFHGQCVRIDKEVGENLVEKFVCPNCTDGKRFTRFKKTCSYRNCNKPARIYSKTDNSVFCSDEHCHSWWEKMIGTLPKKQAVRTTKDELTQEDFMGLLSSDLSKVNEKDGVWKITSRPFTAANLGDETPGSRTKALPPGVLTAEEEAILQTSASDRYKIGEEIVLCKKMLQLLEMANDRRKTLISTKKLEETACGYDYRLDEVGASAPFATWINTDDGKEIFRTGSLDGSGGMDQTCIKKKCKAHMGWYVIHTRDVRHQIKGLASEAKGKLDTENMMKDAALERKLRKESESNWVELTQDEEMTT